MAQILPRDLPAVPDGEVNPEAAVIVDDGSGVFKATPAEMVDSGAPIVSQEEAEAGVINTGRMSPLRTAQAIAALGVSLDVLESTEGAGLVGAASGGTVQQDLDAIGGPTRPLMDTLAARTGVLPETVVLERRRTDFMEDRWFFPLTADGMEWHCVHTSNRFETGLGAPNLIVATKAFLYSSSAAAVIAATGASGITADTASATQDASAATRTGTWVGPVTVSGIANSYYTTTPGDTIEYTVTVPAGGTIYAEYPSAVNGGVFDATVELASVEIDEADYIAPLVGSEHIVNTTFDNLTLGVAPIAIGTAGGSYTVTLALSTTNPASGRLYCRRISAFDPIVYNAVGAYGSVLASSSPGESSSVSHNPGTTLVFAYPACTRISFRYWRNTACGQVSFQVFNSAGVEITDLTTTDLDMYGPVSVSAVEVMTDQAEDDYFLHVFMKKTKNASATAYRLYALAGRAQNQEVAGVPGTDLFDVLDVPSNPTNTADYGTHWLFGPGNLEVAIRARIATESAGIERFLSGRAHGFETTPLARTITVDGVDQTTAYNALTVGQTLVGSVITASYQTILKSPTAAQTTAPTNAGVLAALPSIATLDYAQSVSAAGYLATITPTWTANIVKYEDFGVMLQVPSRKSGSKGVGGGFDAVADDAGRNYLLDTYDNAQSALSRTSTGFAFANDEYVVAVKHLNRPEVAADLPSLGGTDYGEVHSYATGLNKIYSQIVPFDPAGDAITAGTRGYTKQVLFRAFKGVSMRQSIGL